VTRPVRLALDAHVGSQMPAAVQQALLDPAPDAAAGRAAVAALLGAQPAEVHFTGGLRGSFQLCLMALAQAYPGRKQLIIGAGEHPTWTQFVDMQRRQGYRITVLPYDANGQVDRVALRQALDDDTLFVSVGWASPDTGAVAAIGEIAAEVRQAGAFMHTNAASALGWVPIDLAAVPVDLLTFSGQSIGGPERVGGLYVRQETGLAPFVRAEAQRYEAAHAADLAAMGVAAGLAQGRWPEAVAAVARWRDRLEQAIFRQVPGVIRLGPAGAGRLPQLATWAFDGIHAGALADLLALHGFRVAAAPVCERSSPLSGGLAALHLSPAYRYGVVTVGLPLQLEESLLDDLITTLVALVRRLRDRSPVARHLGG
jgi:cysteine desulfurase